MENELTIVLPVLVYNKYQYKILLACLRNLRYFTYPEPFKLIVIHNQAHLCPQLEKELEDFKDVIYLPQEGNLGPTKSLNYGIQMAVTKYVCILGEDILVHQDWYKNALEVLGEYDFVIPWMWRLDEDKFYEASKTIKVHQFQFTDGGGNCCLFKKETYLKLGPLDENLTIFGDRDYNERMHELKMKVGSPLNSHVSHIGSISWILEDTDSKEMEKIFGWKMSDIHEKDRVYFTKKWGRGL